MRLRFYHANLLSESIRDDETPVFYVQEGEIWCDGGKITFRGPKSEASEILRTTTSPQFDEEIDCGGDLLMPGMKNMHTHSPMTFLRSYAEGLPLERWLNEAVFPMEALLDAESVEAFTKVAILEYLRNGTTTIFDMYHFEDSVAKACSEMGMRFLLCGNVNLYTGSLSDNESRMRRLNATYTSPMGGFRLGAHAEYTNDIAMLEMLASLAHEWKSPFYAHMSETIKEVEDCKARYGKSPVELFCDLGLFDHGGGIFHGVWLSDRDLTLLKEHGVGIISNPGSNGKLASGMAPYKRILDAGVKLGFGTDGPASNNALDMFREIYLAALYSKLSESDAIAVPDEAFLEGVLYGGTQIANLNIGDAADFILVGLRSPNMQPKENIVPQLIYSASGANVRMTVIDGKILYRDGVYKYVEDVERIYEDFDRHLKQIKSKRGTR
ncbi:MAG: amidohydrolase [Lachnospiraceae bacterium]|nr:amidohydrolase [Lachnospiraceae bacterium]